MPIKDCSFPDATCIPAQIDKSNNVDEQKE